MSEYTVDEYKDVLAELLAFAQEGYFLAIYFLLFTNGGRLLADAIGLPFFLVWRWALEE